MEAIALTERAEKERKQQAEREKQKRAEERAQLACAIAAEESKLKALRHVAADWAHAGQLRAFIEAARDAAVRNGQQVEPGTAFGDWLLWAGEQADRLDPLAESPASILDRVAETEPEWPEWASYGQPKPEPPFRFPKPIWRGK